jgi:cell division protein FtsL
MGEYGLGYLGIERTRRFKKIKRAGAFIVSAAACVVLLMYVSQRVKTIESGYAVENLKSERSDLARVNELLRVEAATLSSPSRIEKVAASMLGMRVPRNEQVVVVRELRRENAPAHAGNAKLVRNGPARSGSAGG